MFAIKADCAAQSSLFATLYLPVHYLIGVILVFNLQVLYTQRAITVATTTLTFFS